MTNNPLLIRLQRFYDWKTTNAEALLFTGLLLIFYCGVAMAFFATLYVVLYTIKSTVQLFN